MGDNCGCGGSCCEAPGLGQGARGIESVLSLSRGGTECGESGASRVGDVRGARGAGRVRRPAAASAERATTDSHVTALPVTRATLPSVLEFLLPVQDAGSQDTAGTADTDNEDSSPTDGNCVSDTKPYGCIVYDGVCRDTLNVIWENPATIKKYNVILDAIRKYREREEGHTEHESAGRSIGSSRNVSTDGTPVPTSVLRACGPTGEFVMCSGNAIVYAIVEATGTRVPTQEDVDIARTRAKAEARGAAKRKDCKDVKQEDGDACPVESDYVDAWSAGFAVNIWAGALASFANEAWDSMAGRESDAGRDFPGGSPFSAEGSYWVCAAAQVARACGPAGEDPPPPPIRQPEDPPPDNPGGTPTGRRRRRRSRIGEREPLDPPPPPRIQCTVEDDQKKCCYRFGEKCIDYGCRIRGNKDRMCMRRGDTCECVVYSGLEEGRAEPENEQRNELRSVGHRDGLAPVREEGDRQRFELVRSPGTGLPGPHAAAGAGPQSEGFEGRLELGATVVPQS